MYCLISYQKMVELGILESAGPKHSRLYEFNNLYYTYFWIKAFEKNMLANNH